MIVGLDIGGTKILGVALDADGRVVAEDRITTPRQAEELPGALFALSRSLEARPAAVGVGIAGLIDHAGHVGASPHIPGVEHLDLPRALAEEVQAPVHVDNDANVAAWGEARLGAGRGISDLVVVTVGTGIGAGVIVGGRLLRGTHGFAGEAGHMIVDRAGAGHVTGLPGAWEMYASGTSLGRSAHEAGLDGRGEELGQRLRDGRRDERVEAVFDRFTWELALGVANVVTLLDPQMVILGGGVASIGEPLRAAVWGHLPALCFGWEHRRSFALAIAELGERAGAMGAAVLAADLVG